MGLLIAFNIITVFFLLNFICRYKFVNNELKTARKNIQRMDGLFRVANQWLIQCINGKSICLKLEQLKISTIAIYGMGELGERIMEDILLNSSLNLLYGIDRNAEEKKMAIPIYTLEQACHQEKPDIMVLSTYVNNDGLKNEIEDKMKCKVVTLGEFLNDG